MHLAEFPVIEKLTVKNKIILVEELWESISKDASNLPVPESHKTKLQERLVKYEARPDDILSLKTLRKNIDKRK